MQQHPLKQHNNYQTSDLGFCAALVSANVPLVSMDKSMPRRVLFLFEQNAEITRMEADYWANRLPVDARTYFDTVKMLKTRIYA